MTEGVSARRVAVVMTVHNRARLTLRCLRALSRQTVTQRGDARVRVYLVDDGSTDGTSASVRAEFPDTVLIGGDGSLFWNGGMRRGLERAEVDDPDFFLWLNDDTTLAPDALERLLSAFDHLTAASHDPVIVIGAIADPDTGAVNYSGVRRDPVRRLRFHTIAPEARPVRADTMNGNCVLVPRAAAQRVGGLRPGYVHALGDFDYGLRARRAGVALWLAPGVLGTCPSNPGFVVGDGTVRQEWARLRAAKHLPPREWRLFARAWGGPAWPVLWALPYVRRLGWILRQRLRAGPLQHAP